MAGVSAAVGLALTTSSLRYFAGGAAEPLLVAAVLGAVDRHLAGRRGQALALGYAASLLRPECLPFLGLYVLYLYWSEARSPGRCRRAPGAGPGLLAAAGEGRSRRLLPRRQDRDDQQGGSSDPGGRPPGAHLAVALPHARSSSDRARGGPRARPRRAPAPGGSARARSLGARLDRPDRGDDGVRLRWACRALPFPPRPCCACSEAPAWRSWWSWRPSGGAPWRSLPWWSSRLRSPTSGRCTTRTAQRARPRGPGSRTSSPAS